MRKTVVLFAFPAGVSGLSGCGGGSKSSEAAALKNACSGGDMAACSDLAHKDKVRAAKNEGGSG